MDISQRLAELKRLPGFTEHVGMMLVHNGVVRGWSRQDGRKVARLRVQPDYDRIEAIREEYEQRPGIFKVLIEARGGEFAPGDDLLFIVVAGDVRENVAPALSEVLHRVKEEAMAKEEMS
jgi:molybdopterin synthase catalytic subunit